jgi:hypothetical protein
MDRTHVISQQIGVPSRHFQSGMPKLFLQVRLSANNELQPSGLRLSCVGRGGSKPSFLHSSFTSRKETCLSNGSPSRVANTRA